MTETTPSVHKTQILSQDVLRAHPLLRDKIQAALDIDAPMAEVALREVVRFLFLVASDASTSLTPSPRVDLAWHEFILFTKPYREFCDQQLGRFIDHHPGGSDGENRRRYRLALHLYWLTFGTPDPVFWGDSFTGAECGECEAASH